MNLKVKFLKKGSSSKNSLIPEKAKLSLDSQDSRDFSLVWSSIESSVPSSTLCGHMNVRENVKVIVNDDRDTNTNVETTAEFIYLNQRAKLSPDNPKPHQPLNIL